LVGIEAQSGKILMIILQYSENQLLWKVFSPLNSLNQANELQDLENLLQAFIHHPQIFLAIFLTVSNYFPSHMCEMCLRLTYLHWFL
jgi:hypothetical protein